MEKELKHSEKKAYEIAYALFRIAGIVRNERIAEYLESGALKHLRAIILMDLNLAKESGKELEFYLRIGQDLNFIHPDNAQAVISEIRALNEHIAEISGKERLPELAKFSFSGREIPSTNKEGGTLQDIKISLDNINKQIEILSEEGQVAEEVSAESFQPITEDISMRQSNYKEPVKEEKKFGLKIERQSPVVVATEAVTEEDPKVNIFNGETRQMAIYELIRQFGKESGNGCRMRDLQEGFSGVSERTIRYDLEKLIEMGLIERAGQSGPSTYYRTKQLTNNYQLITKAK